MLYLCLNITNPWIESNFTNIFNRSWLLSKFKAFELELIRDTNSLILFVFRATARSDHAGVSFEVGLLGFSINFRLYDTRHWDYDKNSWVNYDFS